MFKKVFTVEIIFQKLSPNCNGSVLLGGDCCCLTTFSLKVCKNKILQNVYDAVIILTVVKTTPTALNCFQAPFQTLPFFN